MKKLTAIIAVFIFFTCCKKSTDRTDNGTVPETRVGFTEYVIEAGAHYTTANGYKQVTNRKQMHFMAWFDSTCIYSSSTPTNQGDINKLYGFSDCNSAHQESSARVGWNWNGTRFDLYAYCYVGGQRQSKLLGSIKPMEKAELTIAIAGNRYLFTMNGSKQSMERECSTETIEGYQLYPYFGGDEVAPHRMKIYIREF